jgi:hypothetical protein
MLEIVTYGRSGCFGGRVGKGGRILRKNFSISTGPEVKLALARETE